MLVTTGMMESVTRTDATTTTGDRGTGHTMVPAPTSEWTPTRR